MHICHIHHICYISYIVHILYIQHIVHCIQVLTYGFERLQAFWMTMSCRMNRILASLHMQTLNVQTLPCHRRSWLKLPCFSCNGICCIWDCFYLRMRWMLKKWLDLVTSDSQWVQIMHMICNVRYVDNMNMLNILNIQNKCISRQPGAYFCPGKNMQNMQNMLFNMYILYILHILWLIMHRTRHFWTLCVWRNLTPHRATCVFTPLFWLDIQNIWVWCVFLHGHWYPRNCSYPIARTMCSSGCQASLMEHFSWGLTISVLQVASSFLNRYNDLRGNENTQMCMCFSSGGIQRSQETRLYFAYSLYCAYIAYSCYDFIWLLHSLDGCVKKWYLPLAIV